MSKHRFVTCEGSAKCHHQRAHCQFCGQHDDYHEHLCQEPLSTGTCTNIGTCSQEPGHSGAHWFEAVTGRVGEEVRYEVRFGTIDEMAEP